MSDVVFWTVFGIIAYFVAIFGVLVGIDLIKKFHRRRTTLRWGKGSDVRLYRSHKTTIQRSGDLDWDWPEGVGTDERE